MLIPVILSGGAGTRLWPVSRELHPKPFIRLPDNENLLQKTLRRAAALPGVTEVLTVTNRDHYFLTRDNYAETGIDLDFDYLLEPVGRNTAPAIAVAAARIMARHGAEAVLLVLSADHLIRDQSAFSAAVDEAVYLASENWLVTFGIKPTAAETGYGYIEMGEALAGAGHKVARFVEKPSADIADQYLASGRHYWNAGLFCFKAGQVLQALDKYAPDVMQAVNNTLSQTNLAAQPTVLDPQTFADVPAISIDYALMERAENVAMVTARFDWSDIGSWSALAQLTAADAQGNRFDGDVIALDSHDNYVSGGKRVIAVVGIKNLIIVDTPDALLVAEAGRAQDVRQVVAEVKRLGHESATSHCTVHRPWGTYTVLDEGTRFKLKRIIVKSGASLSLQKHQHRSEHWVVLSGEATVVNGEAEILVGPNESTYIPAGTPHRLMNRGEIDCVMIEVQVGSYVGEDDIVRLEDKYGRMNNA